MPGFSRPPGFSTGTQTTLQSVDGGSRRVLAFARTLAVTFGSVPGDRAHNTLSDCLRLAERRWLISPCTKGRTQNSGHSLAFPVRGVPPAAAGPTLGDGHGAQRAQGDAALTELVGGRKRRPETFAKGLRKRGSKRTARATGEAAKTLAASSGLGDKVTGSGNLKSALLWPRLGSTGRGSSVSRRTSINLGGKEVHRFRRSEWWGAVFLLQWDTCLAVLLLRERSPGLESPAALGFRELSGKQANGKIHGQALRTGKNERTKS